MITNVTIPEALGYSVGGLAIVFLMLIILMVVIYIMGAVFKGKDARAKKKAEEKAAQARAAAPEVTVNGAKLEGVDPETAGALMELVAEKLETKSEDIKFSAVKRLDR